MAPYGDNGKQPKETKVCTKTRQEEETDMIQRCNATKGPVGSKGNDGLALDYRRDRFSI